MHFFQLYKIFIVFALLNLAPLPVVAAQKNPAPPDATQSSQVVASYISHVQQLYKQCLQEVKNLKVSVKDFLKTPNEKTHSATKEAWKKAKLTYAKTEAFRFYGGPIDDSEGGPEPLINSWPIDESYIDYVEGAPQSGIIQNPKLFPNLDLKFAVSMNEKNGEKNISTGFHAIEFLLWGQDLSTQGPGQRPFTDYITSTQNPHAVRRGQYLTVLVNLLEDQFVTLNKQWEPSKYPKKLIGSEPAESLRRILTGLSTLSLDEMAGERMTVALDGNDQENEQNCFSDLSIEDLIANQEGILEVYLADRGNMSLHQALETSQPKLATQLKAHLEKTFLQLKEVSKPFDVIIASSSKDSERKKLLKIVGRLEEQGRLFAKAASTWGIEINVAE